MNGVVRGTMIAILIFAGCAGGSDTAKPPIILGPIERGQLPPVFQAVYDTTDIQADFIDLIRVAGGGVETKVFLGTWCPDSHREVPRFLKVLDRAGTALGPASMYGLDRTMKSPGGEEAPFAIERVPTFIFFKHGVEIGRIVETPHTSIEGDMVTILASAMNQ